MEGTIGEIIMFAGNFNPKYWSFCQGQTLTISSNTVLFSILGTTYGGNGTTTFQLPNLSGRLAIGAGQGPGLSPYTIGQIGGSESTTLIPANLPPHTHAIQTSVQVRAAGTSTSNSPQSNFWGMGGNATYGTTTDKTMATDAVAVSGSLGFTGSNVPFTNMQPYIGMNFVICTQGVYPQRS